MRCNFCHKGMVLYCPELPTDGFSMDDYSTAIRASLPCTCSEGTEKLNIMYKDPGVQALLQGKRQKAIMQRQYYNRICEEHGKKMVDKSKTK